MQNSLKSGRLFPEAYRHRDVCVRRLLPSGNCIEMNVLPSLLHFQLCDPQFPGPKLNDWRTAYYINSGLEFGIFSVY